MMSYDETFMDKECNILRPNLVRSISTISEKQSLHDSKNNDADDEYSKVINWKKKGKFVELTYL